MGTNSINNVQGIRSQYDDVFSHSPVKIVTGTEICDNRKN